MFYLQYVWESFFLAGRSLLFSSSRSATLVAQGWHWGSQLDFKSVFARAATIKADWRRSTFELHGEESSRTVSTSHAGVACKHKWDQASYYSPLRLPTSRSWKKWKRITKKKVRAPFMPLGALWPLCDFVLSLYDPRNPVMKFYGLLGCQRCIQVTVSIAKWRTRNSRGGLASGQASLQPLPPSDDR